MVPIVASIFYNILGACNELVMITFQEDGVPQRPKSSQILDGEVTPPKLPRQVLILSAVLPPTRTPTTAATRVGMAVTITMTGKAMMPIPKARKPPFPIGEEEREAPAASPTVNHVLVDLVDLVDLEVLVDPVDLEVLVDLVDLADLAAGRLLVSLLIIFHRRVSGCES